eukprot:Clim_evm6s16 gene=Clim_evmTU6s16
MYGNPRLLRSLALVGLCLVLLATSAYSKHNSSGRATLITISSEQGGKANHYVCILASTLRAADLDRVLVELDVVPYATYEHLFVGFAVVLDGEDQLNYIRDHPDVVRIESDVGTKQYQYFSNSPEGSPNLQIAPQSWGLDVIDGIVDDQYSYDLDGAGVHVYVLDSGVDGYHSEFQGRRGEGFSPLTVSSDVDCNGHGTSVAGAVAGTTVGVAKNAVIHSIKVMAYECDKGQGLGGMALAGLDWLLGNAQKPAVLLVTMGAVKTRAAEDAYERLFRENIPVIAAAGNIISDEDYDEKDMCREIQPAGLSSVLTVGALGRNGKKAFFSNSGSCVDVWAPGEEIYTSQGDPPTTPYTPGSFNKKSGTSMAAAFVAGVAAQILQWEPEATPQDIVDIIDQTSIRPLDATADGDGKADHVHMAKAFSLAAARANGITVSSRNEGAHLQPPLSPYHMIMSTAALFLLKKLLL